MTPIQYLFIFIFRPHFLVIAFYRGVAEFCSFHKITASTYVQMGRRKFFQTLNDLIDGSRENA